MSLIKELYKEFNLDLISQEDNNGNINHNYPSSKKLNSHLNLQEQNKDDKESIVSDLDEDDEPFLHTNELNSNNFFHNPINLNLQEIEDNKEENNNNKLPKYNRMKINLKEELHMDNNNERKIEEDYNEIIKDFLYISGYKTASTISDLQKLQITNIINCSGDLCENLYFSGINYLTLNIRDNVSENIECLFFKCINYISETKEKNGRVLIHCYKGVSRSVSIIISYLIFLHKWNYDEAFDFVQLKRPIANPNIGFYLQLKTFHKRITLDEDRLEIFSVSHFSKSQYDLIVCRLIYNNISLKNDKEKDDEENNDTNEEKNEKREIVLNNKGMFIFAMKKNIFIVQGDFLSEKNYEIYKNESLIYINDIKKFEKLGENIDNIEIIKQNEFEKKYTELINDAFIDIKFSDENFIDSKLYVD
jgi:protein-tyrosine phosphatase